MVWVEKIIGDNQTARAGENLTGPGCFMHHVTPQTLAPSMNRKIVLNIFHFQPMIC
jgi:hypothetical protein